MHSARITNKGWRIDKDGVLRITACVLKTGVYPYTVPELPESLQEQFKGKNSVTQAVVTEEFTPEFLQSLEGKPVKINSHDWVENSAEGTTDDVKEEMVGAVAGTPAVDGEEVILDLVVYDPKVIAKIQRNQLVDVSAAYSSDLGPGNGESDLIQHNLRGNHILLLPPGQGRCGNEVRILNAKGEMPVAELKIGNDVFRFSSADDVLVAENLIKVASTRITNSIGAAGQRAMFAQVDDAGGDRTKSGDYKGKEMEGEWHSKMSAEALNTISDAVKNGEASAAKEGEQATTISSLRAELEAITAKLATLESEEHQESVVKGREEQKGSEAAISETANEDEKKALETELANCKTMNSRKRAFVKVMNSAEGLDVEKATDGEINMAFKTLVGTSAKIKNAKAVEVKQPEVELPSARVGNQAPGSNVHPAFKRRAAK